MTKYLGEGSRRLGDLAYRIEGKAIRSAYRLLGARPSSAPFLSGDSFRALADHILEEGRSFDGAAVAEGDVVFVATHELERFKSEILPSIGRKFTLITHNSDVNIDATRAALADDGRVMRWFAQNAVCTHPKIEAIPIGLENRWRHSNGVVGDFRRLDRRSASRKPRILYGFSVGTNVAERGPALEALRSAVGADEIGWTNSRAYRRELSEYCFVASPPGNGIDCHRTWEALYLGVIPIIKRSAFYDAWQGLPILAVDDWTELCGWDESTLGTRYAGLSSSFGSAESLWMPHWVKRIRMGSTA